MKQLQLKTTLNWLEDSLNQLDEEDTTEVIEALFDKLGKESPFDELESLREFKDDIKNLADCI